MQLFPYMVRYITRSMYGFWYCIGSRLLSTQTTIPHSGRSAKYRLQTANLCFVVLYHQPIAHIGTWYSPKELHFVYWFIRPALKTVEDKEYDARFYTFIRAYVTRKQQPMYWCEWCDLNARFPVPKTGGLTKLSYTHLATVAGLEPAYARIKISWLNQLAYTASINLH